MRAIQWHASLGCSLLPVDTENSVQTLKALIHLIINYPPAAEVIAACSGVACCVAAMQEHPSDATVHLYSERLLAFLAQDGERTLAENVAMHQLARCSFFVGILHSRLLLDPAPAGLKPACVWHVSCRLDIRCLLPLPL
jgi:hypothetical protein